MIERLFHYFTKPHLQTRTRLSNILALSLSLAAIISSIFTYIVLTGTSPEKNQGMIPLVYLNLFLLVALVVVIAKRLLELWLQSKKGLAGSKLHIQLVGLFTFVSIVPAIIVFIFATFYLNGAVQAWFGQHVRAAIDEAHIVAEAYLQEHMKSINQDASAMVLELRPHVPHLLANPELFTDLLTRQADLLNLQEVLVFDENQQAIARSRLTFALEFEKTALPEAFEAARAGEVVLISSEGGDRVRALVRLDPTSGTYLYIGKILDALVLKHLAKTKSAISDYNRLEQQRSGLHITFVLFFSLVALLLMFAAIWMGLTLANILVRPISRLIGAAEQVSQGNLAVRVDETSVHNEIDTLSKAFNHMTSELDHQRQDLVKANKKLDQRRQLIESVLSSQSAGVLGLDTKEKINLFNQRAIELLDTPNLKNALLKTVAPELAGLLKELPDTKMPLNRQITLTRRGITRILQVCIVPENGYVITFDDVTPLLTAQRTAAWADVARKIAHEIKNPLTPIQLSAERLKRRYLKDIQHDPETFQACIDTIIRQVQHIGNLVSEFSSFARMPEPQLQKENLSEILSQAVVLEREAHPEIKFMLNMPPKPVIWSCDQQQIGQVFINLLQNAINALSEEETSAKVPQIKITLTDSPETVQVILEDNGPGFPKEGRERLTEPYYTTRRKGTGLGLAIVAKIIEDHRGQLTLGDSNLGGAFVSLVFPRPIAKRGSIGIKKFQSEKD